MPPILSILIIIFCYTLVGFISYAAQYLFHHIEPGPLTTRESIIVNFGTICVFTCYARCVLVNPGHVVTKPKDDHDKQKTETKTRWCKKCDAYKPPRSHHCRVCKRCVPSDDLFPRCTNTPSCILKMDHHCPWTLNCVGHRTFPHFTRFLFHGTWTMLYLFSLLGPRLHKIWESRNRAYVSTFCCRYKFITHAAQYLGPTTFQLVLLLFVVFVNGVTLLCIGILCGRTVYCLVVNMTSVESWEIERHEALRARAAKRGGYVTGPGGVRMRIRRHEFPYDVGVWRNICIGLGSWNVSRFEFPLQKDLSNRTMLRAYANL